jgi:hypothetical protein
MRHRLLLVPLVVMFFNCLPANAQTNAASLRRIANARFVMVTTENGSATDQRIDPEDRRAVGALQTELAGWKRFTLVYSKEEADIILAVRTAGQIRTRTGIDIGSHQQPTGPGTPSGTRDRTTTLGPILSADSGPRYDLLSVYDADSFPASAPLWRSEQKNGLSAPNFPLFTRLKKDVDQASAKKP